MDELDGRGDGIDDVGVGADNFARGVGEERAHPLAAAQRGVAHRGDERRRTVARGGQRSVEDVFDSLLPLAAPDRESNVRFIAAGSVGVGRLEGLQHAFFQDLHLLLRVLQRRLAVLQQFGAPLVRGQRLLERQLPAFHRGDDLLELGERGFEACGGSGCLVIDGGPAWMRAAGATLGGVHARRREPYRLRDGSACPVLVDRVLAGLVEYHVSATRPFTSLSCGRLSKAVRGGYQTP